MASSNYCFLTCIQVYQEADQVVWFSLDVCNTLINFFTTIVIPYWENQAQRSRNLHNICGDATTKTQFSYLTDSFSNYWVCMHVVGRILKWPPETCLWHAYTCSVISAWGNWVGPVSARHSNSSKVTWLDYLTWIHDGIVLLMVMSHSIQLH